MNPVAAAQTCDPRRNSDSPPMHLSALTRDSVTSQVASPPQEARDGRRATEGMRCVICLGRFKNGHRVRTLPSPGRHTYHAGCIESWLRLKSSCPTCKVVILPRDTEANAEHSPGGRSSGSLNADFTCPLTSGPRIAADIHNRLRLGPISPFAPHSRENGREIPVRSTDFDTLAPTVVNPVIAVKPLGGNNV